MVEETGRTGGFGPIAVLAQRIFATRSYFDQPDALPQKAQPAARHQSLGAIERNSLIVRNLYKQTGTGCQSVAIIRHYRAVAARTCTTGICWP